MLPELTPSGELPPGLYAASLAEVRARFGTSPARERQAELLRQIVAAAQNYASIKRVLIWGSFVSGKLEPNDLDYSLVVSIEHRRTQIAPEHRRFLVPFEARQFYHADPSYLVITDFPLEGYFNRLDFLLHNRELVSRGIVEINLRGEIAPQLEAP